VWLAPRLEGSALKLRAVHVPGVAVLAVGAFLLAPSVASAAIRIDDLAVQEGDSSHPVAVRVADDGPSTTTRCMNAYASPASGNESVNAGIKGLAYNNQDFVFPPTSESLCLAPGQTEGSIPLTVLGDTTREADELLSIGVSAPGGPVEFADDSALVTLLNDDGSTVSECLVYAESRLGISVKSVATSLKQLGIVGLLSSGRKFVGTTGFCGNSKIAVTVRYGRAVVAKGVTQGKYNHYVPVHGGVHLARTRKTGRLKGLQRARLKFTVRIWDSEGHSIAGSRKVKIGLRGSGGGTPGTPR
jgi:hypothetical protein